MGSNLTPLDPRFDLFWTYLGPRIDLFWALLGTIFRCWRPPESVPKTALPAQGLRPRQGAIHHHGHRGMAGVEDRDSGTTMVPRTCPK